MRIWFISNIIKKNIRLWQPSVLVYSVSVFFFTALNFQQVLLHLSYYYSRQLVSNYIILAKNLKTTHSSFISGPWVPFTFLFSPPFNLLTFVFHCLSSCSLTLTGGDDSPLPFIIDNINITPRSLYGAPIISLPLSIPSYNLSSPSLSLFGLTPWMR